MRSVYSAIAIFTLAATPALAAKQVVPAYYPLWSSAGVSDWDAMCDGMNSSGNGSIAIVNPDSGPYTQALTYVSDAISYCHGTGNNVIGYVSTSYGTRSIADVKTDIDRYYSFYSTIDGIFLDEMATSATATASGCDSSCTTIEGYYAALHDYVDSIGGATNQNEVIGNMGVSSSSTEWALSDDVVTKLVVFEGSGTDFLSWSAPSWVANYLSSDFVVLVYDLPSTDISSAETNQASNNVNNRYFTDRTLASNPWAAIASYGIQ